VEASQKKILGAERITVSLIPMRDSLAEDQITEHHPIPIPGSSDLILEGLRILEEGLTSAEEETLEVGEMVEENKEIDLKWSLIEGEWVIYKSELDEWVKEKGAPLCPVCHKNEGIRNILVEKGVKRGICKGCGARMVILP
jgi:hypothetical protein